MPFDPELAIAELRPGDHFCLVYQSPGEQLSAAASFLERGLALGEQCLYVSHPSNTAIGNALLRAGVRVDREQNNGALIVATEAETFLRTGAFSPVQMCQLLQKRFEEAMRHGFRSMRVAADMGWLKGTGEYDKALEYEAKMEEFHATTRAIGMEQYPKDLFPPERLLAITRHHNLACMNGLVAENHCVRIRQENFFVDILEDKHGPGFHYVVQETGSETILSWGKEPEFREAMASGEFALAQLAEHVKRIARRKSKDAFHR